MTSIHWILQHLVLCTEFRIHFSPSGILIDVRDALLRCQDQIGDNALLYIWVVMKTLDVYQSVRITLYPGSANQHPYSEVATGLSVTDGRSQLIRQCDIFGLFEQFVLYNGKTDVFLSGEQYSY